MTDWLCQGPQIWSMCDVTRRQRPMTALVSFTLEKLARKHALNPTFGLFAAASLFRLPACFISTYLYLSKQKSATRINAQYTSTRKELRNYPKQWLSRNASSVSFGHAEHCFWTVWTPKSLCQNLLKMTFLRI